MALGVILTLSAAFRHFTVRSTPQSVCPPATACKRALRSTMRRTHLDHLPGGAASAICKRPNTALEPTAAGDSQFTPAWCANREM